MAHPRRGLRDQDNGGVVRPSRGGRPSLRSRQGSRRGGCRRRREGEWLHRRVVDEEAPGTVTEVVGTPVRFSDSEPVVRARPPELGEHTEEVLLESGYSWDDIAALSAEGAV